MTICPTHGLPMDVPTSAGAGQPARMCERCHSAFLDAEMRTLAKQNGLVQVTPSVAFEFSITITENGYLEAKGVSRTIR